MAKYTTYTKEHLANALLDLLQEKPIESISISELAEKAQVNRASFYRNFSSKEEVLLYCLESRFRASPVSSREVRSLAHDPYKQTREFFQFLLDERDLLMTLNKINALGILQEFIYRDIGPKEDEDDVESFYRSYWSYGVFGVYSEWIRRGMKQSPEEMAVLIVYKMQQPHDTLVRDAQKSSD